MNRAHESMQKLPDSPGVYLFLGKKKEILYVGKATSLKDRVRSYFSSSLAETRGTQIVQMVEKATRVDFRKTGSVLEALLLEANLIREFKPLYNIRDKDDKSFNYLVITIGEEFPRLLAVRGKDLTRKLGELRLESKRSVEPLVYGPFPHAGQFKEALKLIRKIFPFYDSKYSVVEMHKKNDRQLAFNESIGLCPFPGTTQKEYARTIQHIKILFDGKLQKLLKVLERDMMRKAKEQKFEEAGSLKRQLFVLQHIEDVSLIRREKKSVQKGEFRIEGYDVAHFGGMDTVGVMVVVENGECAKREYRTFFIRSTTKGSDTGALKEILERRLAHPEWQYPRLVVLDGGRAQVAAAKQVFAQAGMQIPIIAVTKDTHHRPIKIQGPIKIKNEHQNDILLANAEAHRFALAVHKRKRAIQLRR